MEELKELYELQKEHIKVLQEKIKILKHNEESYYLAQYSDSYGGISDEGVFTKKGWEDYIKEENKYRDEDDKWEETMKECEELGQFIFTEIEVYK